MRRGEGGVLGNLPLYPFCDGLISPDAHATLSDWRTWVCHGITTLM